MEQWRTQGKALRRYINPETFQPDVALKIALVNIF